MIDTNLTKALRHAVLDLYERVERLEWRGQPVDERLDAIWKEQAAALAGGDKLDQLMVQDQDAADDDGPAVPEGGQAAKWPGLEAHLVAISDQRLPSGWQPIETAPQDGTEILATNEYEMDFVKWHPPRWPGDDGWWMRRNLDPMFPTWWQPLPDHPPLTGSADD